jgi:hypothetical protein
MWKPVVESEEISFACQSDWVGQIVLSGRVANRKRVLLERKERKKKQTRSNNCTFCGSLLRKIKKK